MARASPGFGPRIRLEMLLFEFGYQAQVGQEAVKESSFPELTSTIFLCNKVLLLFAM